MSERRPGDILLHLRPQSIPGWPVAVRLRLVLKRLLRFFGFACVEALEVPADGGEASPAAQETATPSRGYAGKAI